jgi:hypothetical protein
VYDSINKKLITLLNCYNHFYKVKPKEKETDDKLIHISFFNLKSYKKRTVNITQSVGCLQAAGWTDLS